MELLKRMEDIRRTDVGTNFLKKRTMTFSQTIWLAFLFFIFSPTFGQVNCDTLSPELIRQFDTYSQKKFHKLINKKNLTPWTAFDIATYFRFKSDTTYRQWYRQYIELEKKFYNNLVRKRLDFDKDKMFFNWGKAYYYLDNFENANKWFIRAIKAGCNDICLDYYINETKKQLGIQGK
jgi:hypothetical protein